MPNLNRVMLMGNLTRDPELRYLPSNTPVVNLGLAINRRWKNQQGENQEETTFIDCEAFGRTAEVINQYLRKGRPLFIEGRLKLDQWQDKEGQARSKLKVVVESFEFVDSREGGPGGGGGEGGGGAASQGSAPRGEQRRYGSGNAGGTGGGERSGGGGSGGRSNPNPSNPPAAQQEHVAMDDEDIPF